MIDILALSRHGQSAINALPTALLYNGVTATGSFRTTNTAILGIDGGTITEIGGSAFISKQVCFDKFGSIPKPETQIQVQQKDLSFLPFFIENVLGKEDPTLTEVTLVLGPVNK